MQRDRWCVRRFSFIDTAWTDIVVPPEMPLGCNQITLRPGVNILFGDDSNAQWQDGLAANATYVIGSTTWTPEGGESRPSRFVSNEVVFRVQAAPGLSGVVIVEFLR